MSPTVSPTDPLSITTAEFLTEREVAKLLRCSLRHLANLRVRGDLPYFRVGERRVIYLRRDVLRLLERSYVAKGASSDAA